MSHEIVKGILIAKHGPCFYLATNSASNNVTPRTYRVGFYSIAFESEAAVKAFLFASRMSGSVVFDSTLARIRKVDSQELQGAALAAFERLKPRLENARPCAVEDGIDELTRNCVSDYHSIEQLALMERAVIALRSGAPIPNPNEELRRPAPDRHPLLRSISQGGLSPAARALLAASPEMAKEVGPFGVAPLHRLSAQYAWGGYLEGVLDSAKLLLDHGAYPNAKNALGMTPLHVCAEDSSSQLVALAKLLMERGADADARDLSGQTPLHRAAVYGRSTEMCAALIAKGADLDALDGQSLTPLMRATRSEDVVAFLIDAGADLDKVDAQGQTAESHARADATNHSSAASLALIQSALRAREERAALASITAGKTPAPRIPARSL